MMGRGRRRILLFLLGILLALAGVLVLPDLLRWPGACAVLAYQDLDCDGQPDGEEEPRLAGVCAWSGRRPWPPSQDYCLDPRHRTDGRGVWLNAGGEGRPVVVQAPEGFVPTSATIQGCTRGMLSSAAFSFAPTGACPQRAIPTAEAAYRGWIAWHVAGGIAVLVLLVGLVLFLWRSRAA